MEGMVCSKCSKLSIPLHHCVKDHIICSKCLPSPLLKPEPCLCCKRKGWLYYCDITSKLLSNIIIACGNSGNGCRAYLSSEDYNQHLEGCPFSKYICPICKQEFPKLKDLKSHCEEDIHDVTMINAKEKTPFSIHAEQSLLLQEASTKDMFVLASNMGSPTLQHMSWDNPRHYNLTAHVENRRCSFSGKTSKFLSPTPVAEGLPLSFSAQNIAYELELELDLKSDFQALLGTVTSTRRLTRGLECCMCLQTTTLPIYHCIYSHLFCDKCRDFDCNGNIIKCELARSLLKICDFDCPNKANGCNKKLTIEEIYTHLEGDYLKRSFCCPKCPQEYLDLEEMIEHLASHLVIEFRFDKVNDVIAKHGFNLIVEEGSREYYLLIVDGDEMCVQHMYKAKSRRYLLSITDEKERTWSFDCETSEMEMKLKMTPDCFKLPMTRQPPYFPFGVSLMIRNQVD